MLCGALLCSSMLQYVTNLEQSRGKCFVKQTVALIKHSVVLF